MKLYKAQIELLSPISTPLKGDTIWGHVVWGIANHEGSDVVTSFLEACKTEEPPLVISSAFPEGMLPRPIVEEHVECSILTKSKYTEIKEKKKNVYIPSFLEGPITKDMVCHGFLKKQVQMHNTISRFDLTVLDGELFAKDSLWANPEAFKTGRPIFDIYVASSYTPELLFQYLRWAFENGYGADASSGKGAINVLSEIMEVAVPPLDKKRCMALGPFVSDKTHTIQDLLADVFIRRGKIGGAFASSVNPYKKTVVLYNEGATFINDSDSLFVGKLIGNVHPDERICQSGFCPIIPLPSGGAV